MALGLYIRMYVIVAMNKAMSKTMRQYYDGQTESSEGMPNDVLVLQMKSEYVHFSSLTCIYTEDVRLTRSYIAHFIE